MESNSNENLDKNSTIEKKPRYSTEINHICNGLSRPERNLSKSLEEFKRGDSQLRDISGYSRRARDMVLSDTSIDKNNQILGSTDLVREFSEIAAENLKNHMEEHEVKLAMDPKERNVKGIKIANKYPGFNFLSEIHGFLEKGSRGAKMIDQCFQKEYGKSVMTLLEELFRNKNEINGAHLLVSQIASRPENALTIGYYLAERSALNEERQKELYEPILDEVKSEYSDSFLKLARQLNLPEEHIQRTLEQIKLTGFSSFDPLLEGITVAESCSLGDYSSGSHSIEVKFGGNTRNPTLPSKEEARKTIRHEVGHSAQAQDENCLGLDVGNHHGTAVSEGLVEYLAQYAGNFPDLRELPNGSTYFNTPYSLELNTHRILSKRHPEDFKAIFHANFGNILPGLRDALQNYYRILKNTIEQSKRAKARRNKNPFNRFFHRFRKPHKNS